MRSKKTWPAEIPRIGGLPEQPVLLIYDIEEDRLRNKLADLCKDFGLHRIQFSAFFGQLTRNHREELAMRCGQLLEDSNGKVLIQPVCDRDRSAAVDLLFRKPEDVPENGPEDEKR